MSEARVAGGASAPLKFVELDDLLSDDPSGLELRQMVERLSEGKRQVQAELARGVTSDRHEKLVALSRAYDVGIEALPELWSNLNQRSK